MAKLEEIINLGNTSKYNPPTDESLQSLIGFRLKPRFTETINITKMKKVMEDVHRAILDEKMWNDLDPNITCNIISNDIKDGVGNILKSIRDDNRYKYIVQTFITKFNSQSVKVSTRCLWDVKTDRIAYKNYINEFIVCSSIVIFIFYY